MVLGKVKQLRKQGVECYFTMDAGPNVKILCLENNIKKIKEEIEDLDIKTIECKAGNDAKLVEEHLF